VNRKSIAGVTLAALLAIAAAMVYSTGVQSLPPDDSQLPELKRDGLMGGHHAGILPVFADALKPDFMAGVCSNFKP
jgi:hypothetical protein